MAAALVAPARADVDTDFANQLPGKGIYRARDDNARLAQIVADPSGQVLPMLLLARESLARTVGGHSGCLRLSHRNFLQPPFQPCDPE